MSPSERRLQITTLDSARHRYRVVSLLGRGGYGSVFKAVRLETLETVAIKLINPPVPACPSRNGATPLQQIRQLRHEITLCGTLCHPNLAGLHDWGESADGQVFAVFDYVPGETLRERLLLRGGMDGRSAVSIMTQVLAALVYLHAQGVVHCDIKPHNIMLLPADPVTPALQRAKIIDFGSAVQLPVDPFRQRDARTACSPAYSAPEQLRGAIPSPSVDIYAWGLVLLECLSGQSIVSGRSMRRVIERQLSDEPIPIPVQLEGHPLGALLRQATHKNAQGRIADSAQLQRQLLLLDLAGIPDAGPDPRRHALAADQFDDAATRSRPLTAGRYTV
ncbi:serine/threonine-protein kinase [Massilia mucilaginosa]|uniref:serine/threonine-protein kinase n=1 Tax=Massilia mucilaginosa TaxID=2609282 RepID=UPI001420FD41|nr:serine/threonine-protein kinase [Massilia mucilaginosa]